MADILFVAAEASSVLYAERLMQLWKKENKNFSTVGVGSSEMESMGMKRLGKAEEMAVVGFSEALQKYSELKKVYNSILEEIDQNPPKVAVLLDYPGFNLRLAKDLKARKIPVVYYVSPQIWAWKKGRVHTVKKYVDKMLVILPFEVDFYKKFEVPVEFVGHPLLEELDPRLENPTWIQMERSRRGIPNENIVLGIMPGSRLGELDRHIDVQIEVARKVYKAIPNLTVMILVAPTFTKEQIADRLENLKIPYILIKDTPFSMIAMTDFVLAASGTATLMVGLLKKPMIIMYKMSAITALIGRLLVSGYFGLVNLILNKEAVPEIFQGAANPENLSEQMIRLIKDKQWQDQMRIDLEQLRKMIGEAGATVKAARAIEKFLETSQ